MFNLDQEPGIDIGKILTLENPVSLRNLWLSVNYGDVLHVGIVYNYSDGIWGVKYSLFVAYKATRNK